MDTLNSTTKRGKFQHLNLHTRSLIQAYLKTGMTMTAIAKEIGCSVSTISREVRRGTPEKQTNIGRPTEYIAPRAQEMADDRHTDTRRANKMEHCKPFLDWMIVQVREEGWSFDACVGRAGREHLFPDDQIPSTTTLYLWQDAGLLDLDDTELPEKASRNRKKQPHSRENKRFYGKSIEERDPAIETREEFGHWEGDTVVGHRKGPGAVVLTLLERKTHQYLVIKMRSKSAYCVQKAFQKLKEFFGDLFSTVFKSITADNGSEFADLSTLDAEGVDVYFTHPYSSYEKGQNERHNRILRRYLPKGCDIDQYSEVEIFGFMDCINNTPRRSLNYSTPEELFEAALDEIYALDP